MAGLYQFAGLLTAFVPLGLGVKVHGLFSRKDFWAEEMKRREFVASWGESLPIIPRLFAFIPLGYYRARENEGG